MDGNTWGFIGTAAVVLGGIVATLVTRRSASESNKSAAQVSAVTGFVQLNTALEHRVERLEAAEVARLAEDRRKADLAVKHRTWDGVIYDQALVAGWEVTPPPPLD